MTELLEILKLHGFNATCFQVLEPGYEYFRFGEDAFVAYVDTGSAWVAAGAPIAPAAALDSVAAAFVAAAHAKGRRCGFFATEPRFVAATPLAAICIGEQPVWDPARWPEIRRSSSSLREQLRRARAKGVTVRLVPPEELRDAQSLSRRAIEALIARWLGARAMAPMGFLVQLSLFAHADERLCLLAEVEGQPCGVLGMIPVYARSGWFCEDMLRDPAAPNGTVELLIDAAMGLAAQRGSHYVTLGLAPLSGGIARPLRAARRFGAGLYDFEGLRAFKAKLKPHEWVPIYLSYPSTQNSLLMFLDVLVAFARGGLLRFGIQTLLRGPALLVRLLAILLVPWIVLLVLAPAAYFPLPAVKWSWVGFDLVLAGALLRLTYAWQPKLAALLWGLVSADAVLTLGEAVLYNFPRAHGPVDVGIITVAVAGPALAAFLLFRGRLHRQRSAVPALARRPPDASSPSPTYSKTGL